MTLVPTVMAHGQANAEIREDASPSLTCNHEAPIVAHTLRGEGFDASEDGTGRGTPLVAVFENHAQDSRIKEVSVVPALSAKAGTGGNNLPLVSTPAPVAFESRIARNGRGAPDEVVPPLKAQSGENGTGDGAPLIAYTTKLENTQSNQSGKVYEEYAPRVSRNSAALMTSASVRRLTPRECERLQGFPDDWTLVKHGKKLTADGPRYKALGNSMAVPVMSWIGRRIQIVDDMLKELRG
jgi:DNA (cytosine-5)-methyltransferase 1